MTDTPNDPSLRSFIDVDPTSPFPIQNLPFGVFECDACPGQALGVALGEYVVSLPELNQGGLLQYPTYGGPSSLDEIMPRPWRLLRPRLSWLLRDDNPLLRDNLRVRKRAFIPQRDVRM